ncbi:hypothetical protein AAV35_001370 [Salimicrobium jeotgali]|uniref:Uncharacterized protein n=1 Tax=Salimicrobium jeotgali TaxID=1230341 RepID=K2FMA9_9BACI|nr:hypothetical protein [Salimicrobium jeotgali]AKG03565.1 hypothetical protein AAV35_001370 [Salimicrobium jeotgali]EKE32056.1 hypothetical protein MJ3_05533 [Salimicrobium jeotgali]MBM7696023.1 gas vesicle protein [Salimicrobium jeotgali]
MGQNYEDSQNNKRRGNKLPFAMVSGALVGAVVVLASDSEERKRVKSGSSNAKNKISSYANRVKEDPQGVKDDWLGRIQRAASITKEAVQKIQEILDEQGNQLKESAQDIQNESKEMIETAKDAGDELQSVGEKASEAKEELSSSESSDNTSTSGSTGDNVTDINDKKQ